MMQPWIESSHAITYEVLETFARGPVVINRRIDIYHSETNHLEWEGVDSAYLVIKLYQCLTCRSCVDSLYSLQLKLTASAVSPLPLNSATCG